MSNFYSFIWVVFKVLSCAPALACLGFKGNTSLLGIWHIGSTPPVNIVLDFRELMISY